MAINQQPFLSLAVDRQHGLTSNNTKAHYPGTLGVHLHEHARALCTRPARRRARPYV